MLVLSSLPRTDFSACVLCIACSSLTSTAELHHWSHFTRLPTAAWRDLMAFSAYQHQAFKFPHFSDSDWKEFKLVAWEGTSGVSPLCSFSSGSPKPETSTALWPALDYSHWTQAIPLQPPGNQVKPVGGPQLYNCLSKMCLSDCSPLECSSSLVTTWPPRMAGRFQIISLHQNQDSTRREVQLKTICDNVTYS